MRIVLRFRMQYIPDGYNRRAILTCNDYTLRVIYRPALSDERALVRYEAKFLRGQSAKNLALRFTKSHVVEHEPDLEAALADYPSLAKQLFLLIQGVIPDLTGERWAAVESKYEKHLRMLAELEFTNPRLANRSCSDCQKFWYNEQTGLPIIQQGTGLPLARFGPTLCQTPNGCPKGNPEINAEPMAIANKWAISHFLSCEAVGIFPDDPVVKRHARLIRHERLKIERKRK